MPVSNGSAAIKTLPALAMGGPSVSTTTQVPAAMPNVINASPANSSNATGEKEKMTYFRKIRR